MIMIMIALMTVTKMLGGLRRRVLVQLEIGEMVLVAFVHGMLALSSHCSMTIKCISALLVLVITVKIVGVVIL